jgi:hypothetical protein
MSPIRAMGSRCSMHGAGLFTGDSVTSEANAAIALSQKERVNMARRRYQKPVPMQHGKHWTIIVTEDYLQDGQPKRRQKRVRLAPLETKWRTVLRLRDEKIKPLNQGMLAWGSATDFNTFVQQTYIANEMPLLAKTTQQRYRGVLDKYLLPQFGTYLLRDLTMAVTERRTNNMKSILISILAVVLFAGSAFAKDHSADYQTGTITTASRSTSWNDNTQCSEQLKTVHCSGDIQCTRAHYTSRVPHMCLLKLDVWIRS